ncbi:hypothetical protein VTN02DRAFT_5248 [Thermoascus thermophilus]
MQRIGKLGGMRRMRKTTVPSFLPQQQAVEEEEPDQVRDPGQRSRVYRIYNSGESLKRMTSSPPAKSSDANIAPRSARTAPQ